MHYSTSHPDSHGLQHKRLDPSSWRRERRSEGQTMVKWLARRAKIAEQQRTRTVVGRRKVGRRRIKWIEKEGESRRFVSNEDKEIRRWKDTSNRPAYVTSKAASVYYRPIPWPINPITVSRPPRFLPWAPLIKMAKIYFIQKKGYNDLLCAYRISVWLQSAPKKYFGHTILQLTCSYWHLRWLESTTEISPTLQSLPFWSGLIQWAFFVCL